MPQEYSSPTRPRRAVLGRLLAGPLLATGAWAPRLWAMPAPAHAAASTQLPAAQRACVVLGAWPDWLTFKQALLRNEGRIADPRGERWHTVSEGQAYALFFALVANDRPAFDALLAWTERELCAGSPSTTLPAWHWGRDDTGRWRVLDANAASDADLWLAYTLAQAGRLWQQPALVDKAGRLASLIASRELLDAGARGTHLLPGPAGFADSAGQLRLNPSYAPLPLLRWFAAYAAGSVWQGVLRSTVEVLTTSAPRGLAPDWWLSAPPGGAAAPGSGASMVFAPSGPVQATRLTALVRDQRLGGFDAIRVYLWLGLTAPDDPLRARLLTHFSPMCDVVERLGQPPLQVDPARGVAEQAGQLKPGPRGFAAALLPFAQALGRTRCVAVLKDRLRHEPADARVYYDSALCLFAQGQLEGRYSFGPDGSLWTAWSACAAAARSPT
jgi:endoglucanase